MWLHLFFLRYFCYWNFADINWLNLRKIYTTTTIIYLAFRLILHNKELHNHLFNSIPVSKIVKVIDFGGELSALFGFYADLLRFSVEGPPYNKPPVMWCDGQCDAMMRWAIRTRLWRSNLHRILYPMCLLSVVLFNAMCMDRKLNAY